MSCCQGFIPTVWHPQSVSEVIHPISTPRRSRTRMAVTPEPSVSVSLKQRLDLSRQCVAIFEEKPLMPRRGVTAAVDKEAGRHATNAEPLGQFPFRVVDDPKLRRMIAQELLSIRTIAIHVDADHHQSVRPKHFLQAVHEGKGLSTGRAP